MPMLRSLILAAARSPQVERMVEAAPVAKNLRHSKLAAVLDVIVAEQEIALIGEYVEGPTLSLLQRLAYGYIGPDVVLPSFPDPPDGWVIRIAVDRITGSDVALTHD